MFKGAAPGSPGWGLPRDVPKHEPSKTSAVADTATGGCRHGEGKSRWRAAHRGRQSSRDGRDGGLEAGQKRQDGQGTPPAANAAVATRQGTNSSCRARSQLNCARPFQASAVSVVQKTATDAGMGMMTAATKDSKFADDLKHDMELLQNASKCVLRRASNACSSRRRVCRDALACSQRTAKAALRDHRHERGASFIRFQVRGIVEQ